ncbi:hypothetical protein PUNSTDRAFT_139809 [Punctularia strigosozonata HHB-11173 SS5]|uniref:uncharacterized protein n=1 Tax=Punctularia strigosozonata (strain HHB-11173) TaxID=741275 RepID=UPI0004416821|nr:uncharacterized protein PUNSTDRAFT_139809 [Punctularia strigosozonata HHB-11173 SS5]EIN13165.1 hypothetical protein PUNSTDRAFT_139809 [Punctularia strigosozonata HHB-11173 SS5]
MSSLTKFAGWIVRATLLVKPYLSAPNTAIIQIKLSSERKATGTCRSSLNTTPTIILILDWQRGLGCSELAIALARNGFFLSESSRIVFRKRLKANAQVLRLKAFKAYTSAAWDVVLDALFQRSTEPLRILEIHAPRKPHKYDDSSYDAEEREVELPRAFAILQMPYYVNLRELVVSAQLAWTDEVVAHVARVCPALTRAELRVEKQRVPADSPRLTSLSLVEFAEHCPLLCDLFIHVDIPAEADAPLAGSLFEFGGNASLIDLDLGEPAVPLPGPRRQSTCLPISGPIKLEDLEDTYCTCRLPHFLKSLFPSLQQVSGVQVPCHS